jgi:hypothetical protein
VFKVYEDSVLEVVQGNNTEETTTLDPPRAIIPWAIGRYSGKFEPIP